MADADFQQEEKDKMSRRKAGLFVLSEVESKMCVFAEG